MAKSKDDLIADALEEIASRHGVEFPIKGELTAGELPAVYEALSLPLPTEARQHVSARDNPRNFEMTGYKYQYVVNRLNDVLGLGHWEFSTKVLHDGFEDAIGGKMHEVLLEITIMLGNWCAGAVAIPGQHGCFAVLATRTGFGGNANTSRADAYKGAITDTFKKVAAFFGVGRQAYELTIDEAHRPADVERGAAQERGGGKPSAQPETHDPPSDVEQPPASASSTDTLRKAFCAVCKGKSLNRFSILARTYRVISTEGLTAEELVTLTKATTEGVHDTCAGTGTGDKAELLGGISLLMVGYLEDSGTALEDQPANLTKLEAAFAKAVGKDDYAKLTVAELRQQAQGVSERCQELRKLKAAQRDLAKRWLIAMRREVPDAATNDLVRALDKAAATVGEDVGEGGYKALSIEQLEELGQKMSLGFINVLTGEEREAEREEE